VFWVELGTPRGSAPGCRHPHVVIQSNLLNRSNIANVVLCPLTSELKWADAPGNVLLRKGEANLPKRSVVNVSQLITVDKADLLERIGVLSRPRLHQVLQGVMLVLEPE